ncbi:MAG: M20 aminoacylase family protein, partial [Rhodoferax sp.]
MRDAPTTVSPVEYIRRYHPEFIAIRRDLHAHPELGFEEARTSEIVATLLESWGVQVHRGIARTGVVGVVQGKYSSSARSVGLRADMDCLAMQEEGSVAHKSCVAGRMHGCGHDGHTAMLLGAARYLAETRNFDGTAYLIFQPAEEGGGGARVMIEEGLFERFPMDAVYGLHNWPLLPAGKMGVRAGPITAATDEIQITVHGKGGHGAMPHLAVDPVVISAHIITALQTIASRNVNPVDAIVVSVCSMATSQIGTFNVIPEAVKMVGTVRSFRAQTRDLAEQRVREIVTSVGQALGARVDIDYWRGYPATVNTEREAALAAKVGEQVFGKENVETGGEPTMGGEDFSYMLLQRPGAYVWLGQGGGPLGPFLH